MYQLYSKCKEFHKARTRVELIKADAKLPQAREELCFNGPEMTMLRISAKGRRIETKYLWIAL